MIDETLRARLARHTQTVQTAPPTPLRADDALKYAAAVLRKRTNWALENIGISEERGSTEDYGDDVHGNALEAMYEVVEEIEELAARFPDPRHYADGRQIKTSKRIVGCFVAEHIWHPVAAEETPSNYGGRLPSLTDDSTSPARYEVSTDPATQTIHTRVVKSV
ncbi:hypothetical protein [Mycolicibacterium fluoranthenivorans]|uniref:Uncharacterized protein n=1 Tax=Mycolicibacterium fluoranthenivorans TaxID=258505 RepID=A0A1G4W1E0_9MYCO|nr:hypothetical protein [Mycolicibacterium fluoranthenivorans]SCX15178.1 hypothetical protein SAMN02799620_02012 [Mycolicibacterium fluoranthenivorans]